MHVPFFLAWDLIVHLAEEFLLLFKAMGRDVQEPHAASLGYRRIPAWNKQVCGDKGSGVRLI